MRYAFSLTILATLAAPLLLLHGGTAVAGQAPAAPAAPPLTLTTTAFPDGGVIPDRYTQAGEQVSPALSWTNVPAGTAFPGAPAFTADPAWFVEGWSPALPVATPWTNAAYTAQAPRLVPRPRSSCAYGGVRPTSASMASTGAGSSTPLS